MHQTSKEPAHFIRMFDWWLLNVAICQFQGLSGDMGLDDKPYVTLSYANGPGYDTTFANGERINLTDVDTSINSKWIRDSFRIDNRISPYVCF